MLAPLRDGLRSLVKRPALSVPAVLVLALSLAAATALLSAVNALLVRPLPYPAAERMVAAFETLRPGRPSRLPMSGPAFAAVQQRTDLFELTAALARGEAGLDTQSGAAPLRIQRATASVWTLLGVQAALGQVFTDRDEQADAPRVAVLSHALHQSAFAGAGDVLGQPILLDGVAHRVIGVLPANAAPQFDADVWTPLSLTQSQLAPDRARQGILTVIARLREGVTLETAQDRLSDEAQAKRLVDPEARGVSLVSLAELFGGQLREALWVLLAAVAVLLVIAAADVANLLLVRAAERQREFAIRLALGARRKHLVARLLAEGALVALAAAAVGLLGGLWLIEALAPLSTEVVRASGLDVDGRVLGAVVLAALFAGVLAALAPALQATQPPLGESLKVGLRRAGARSRSSMRHALVLIEVALACVLVFAALSSIRGLRTLLQTDPGFEARGVLAVRVALSPSHHPDGASQARFFEQLRARVLTLPDVTSAGFLASIPLSETSPWDFDVEGPSGRGQGHVIELMEVASPGALAALRIPVLQGRGLEDSDREGAPRVALVNAAMARRYWPGEDAIGKKLRPWRLHTEDAFGRRFWPHPAADSGADTDWYTIVGVVSNVRQLRLQLEPRPEVWLPLAQFPIPVGALIIRADRGQESRATLRAEVQHAATGLDRDLALGSSDTLEHLVARSASAERDAVLLLTIFAASALLLAAFGVSGVIASSVAERRREIGIRLALGATAGGVVRLLLGLGMRLALGGVLLGSVCAWFTASRLGALIARPLAFDPLLCLASALLLLVAALLSSLIPARRAAKVHPSIVLQHE